MLSEESGMNKKESTTGSIVSQAAPAAPSHSLIDSRNLVITNGQFHQTLGHHHSLVIHINQGSQADSQSSSPPSNEVRQTSPGQISGQSSQVDCDRNLSQVSSQSQEISIQKSNDTYERHLIPKGRGFPLWIPDPNRVLHLNYRRTGVRIGDVGIITHSGAFSFLFNICLPHNDPVNPRMLPEHFAPISPPIEATDIEIFTVFKNGSHLASASVKRSQTDNAISDIVFESSASEGAILTMPRGARSEDLGNLATFREYAAANVANWYRFVNGPRGREAKNGDVRLVVGFDKTTSWGIATFANQTHQNSCRLKFGPSERDSASTYTWSENSGIADVRAGPDSDESDELRIENDPPDIQFENQCLFVRTLNVTLADDIWADIHSSSGSIPVDPRNSQYPRVKNYSDSNRPHSNNPSDDSNFSPSQGAQSGTQRRLQGVDITSDENPPIFVSGPFENITTHPSKILNDTLLAKIPTAKMVITQDDDWSSVTQYDTLLDPHEFIENILASRDICQENDIVFLQPKKIIDEVSKDSTSVNRAQDYQEHIDHEDHHTGPPQYLRFEPDDGGLPSTSEPHGSGSSNVKIPGGKTPRKRGRPKSPHGYQSQFEKAFLAGYREDDTESRPPQFPRFNDPRLLGGVPPYNIMQHNGPEWISGPDQEPDDEGLLSTSASQGGSQFNAPGGKTGRGRPRMSFEKESDDEALGSTSGPHGSGQLKVPVYSDLSGKKRKRETSEYRQSQIEK